MKRSPGAPKSGKAYPKAKKGGILRLRAPKAKKISVKRTKTSQDISDSLGLVDLDSFLEEDRNEKAF